MLLSKAEEAQAGKTVSKDELAALEKEVSEQGALVSQLKEVRLFAVVMDMVAASGTCARARCMKQGNLHAKHESFWKCWHPTYCIMQMPYSSWLPCMCLRFINVCCLF